MPPAPSAQLYIGMSDYDAGLKAGEAAKKIIQKGKVVGLVGYTTAQNAQDRMPVSRRPSRAPICSWSKSCWTT